MRRDGALHLARVAAFLLAVAAFATRAGATTEHPGGADREATIKAGMVLNFMRFTEWPDDAFRNAGSPLVVTIVGKGEMGDRLVQIMANQRVHERPVEVRRLDLSAAPETTPSGDASSRADPGGEPVPETEDRAGSGETEETLPPAAEAPPDRTDDPATPQAAGASGPVANPDTDAAAGEGDSAVSVALRTSHVLFICEPGPDGLAPLLAQLKGHDVLTVSDMDRFAEAGGMLGLVIRRGRVAFDANAEQIDGTSLKVSSQLLRLAHIVKTKEP